MNWVCYGFQLSFYYSSTSLFHISKTTTALFFRNNIFKRSWDDHSNHSYTGMSAQICTRMPTYIKCSIFKSWNPTEDGKTRSFTEQNVVPEDFSNTWKWIFSKSNGESPKYGDFVWALFPFLSSLLNSSGKILHKIFRKYPSYRSKQNLVHWADNPHLQWIILFALHSDPAHAVVRSAKDTLSVQNKLRVLGHIVPGMGK